MVQSNQPWYHIDNVDQLDSPCLLVYPERVKHNIALAIDMVGGDPSHLRPHIKTHKSPDATRLMLEAGIHKFKCATIAEAEMLAMTGARDVLLAYQPQGPKAQRFASLIKKYPATRWACLIDEPEAAKNMAVIFSTAGLDVPVYLDLNVGMNRTGIEPGEAAIALYRLARQTTGITPVGLHAYDGHIRDVDYHERKEKCDTAFKMVSALKAAIHNAIPGADPRIIAGGSPTFSIHCKREGIECSPGTFIYWDKGYSDQCPEQGFLPAALVLTRVISHPAADRICTDLGHKSIAAENELTRRVFLLNGEGLTPVGQSEEHLVLQVASPAVASTAAASSAPTTPAASSTPPAPGSSPPISPSTHPTPVSAAASLPAGHVLFGMPFHICPTVALYERAFTIEHGKHTGEWRNTARDRKISV